jgi:hypothetical protein
MNPDRTRAFLKEIKSRGSTRPELIPDKIPPGYWTVYQMSKRIGLCERHTARYIREMMIEDQLIIEKFRTRVSAICIRIVNHFKFRSRHAEKAFIKAHSKC